MSNTMRYHAQKQALVILMEGYTSPDVINQAVMEDALKDYTSYDNPLQRTIAIWAAVNVVKAEQGTVFDDVDAVLKNIITIAVNEAGGDSASLQAIGIVAQSHNQLHIIEAVFREASQKMQTSAEEYRRKAEEIINHLQQQAS